MNTFERLRKLLAGQLNLREESITPQAVIMEDLGADSLDVVEIIMLTEEEFGIHIEQSEETEIPDALYISPCLTVQNLVDYIEKKREE